MNKLTFLNHASFMIETATEVIVIDPWLEGNAFDNGWSLIDKSTSNELMYEALNQLGKPVFIWYSHEHSDHLAIPFLRKLLAEVKVPVQVIYIHTLDKRVVNFLKKLNLDVVECASGEEVKLSSVASIVTWSYPSSDDSFCLIRASGVSILNINDCAVRSPIQCSYIQKKMQTFTKEIDILFTQFGYANWIGNESDSSLRVKAASEKFDRIATQMEYLSPRIVIPFASFVYFSHVENSYMNDHQNSPLDVISSDVLQNYKNRIFFMKPYDSIVLNGQLEHQLLNISSKAIAHWMLKKEACKVELNCLQSPHSIEEIERLFLSYSWRASVNLLFLNALLELVGLIKPLRVQVLDLECTLLLSYIGGMRSVTMDLSDISCSSSTLGYILKNDFGVEAVEVGARFRSLNIGGKDRFSRFFLPQKLLKIGLGVRHPIITARYLVNRLHTSMMARKFET